MVKGIFWSTLPPGWRISVKESFCWLVISSTREHESMGMSTWLPQPCGMLPKGPISLLPFQSTESWAVRLGGSEKLGNRSQYSEWNICIKGTWFLLATLQPPLRAFPKPLRSPHLQITTPPPNWYKGNPKTLLGSALHSPTCDQTPVCTLDGNKIELFPDSKYCTCRYQAWIWGTERGHKFEHLTSTLGEKKGSNQCLGLALQVQEKAHKLKNSDTGRSQECGAGLSTEDLRKPETP